LKQREEAFRARLAEEIAKQVRQARREIDDVIAGLKAKTDEIAREAVRHRVTTGDTGAARTEAQRAIESVAQRVMAPAAAPAEAAASMGAATRQPIVGDRVAVGGLGLEATVTALHDGSAELDLRGKRMRAPIRDLRVLGSAEPQRVPAAGRVTVHVELQPRETVTTDLNIIGCTVDEALIRAERFLDESLLTETRVVRVIHGYGTGQLKRAIAGFLQQHPLVAKFETAPPDQGGGGVTIVELKE
jgi:DNA mismatch repair protein MutS2